MCTKLGRAEPRRQMWTYNLRQCALPHCCILRTCGGALVDLAGAFSRPLIIIPTPVSPKKGDIFTSFYLKYESFSAVVRPGPGRLPAVQVTGPRVWTPALTDGRRVMTTRYRRSPPAPLREQRWTPGTHLNKYVHQSRTLCTSWTASVQTPRLFYVW